MPDSVLELVLLGLLGAGGAGALFVLARRNPAAGLAVWLLVIALVPIWVEIRVGVPLSAASAVGGLLVLALAFREQVTWGLPDLLVAFLFLVSMAPLLVGRLSLSSFSGVVTIWVVAFGLGRLAPTVVEPQRIHGIVAVVFTGVAVLAIVEFLSGWHGLASWGPANSSSATWRPIQVRGGLARSEGAFGHSIALGASLAMALVLTVESRFRPAVRLLMIAVMLAAITTTLSRSALLCAALGLAGAIVFLRTPAARAVRGGLIALVVAAGLVVVPFVARVLDASAEVGGSAAYRQDLLSLVPAMDLFGRSDAFQQSISGVSYFGGFRSIDSQLVLFGLSYGWLTLGLVLLLLALGAGQVVLGRARASTLAVVAQAPALATVALITQYHLFFWFTVGLALAAGSAGHRPRSEASTAVPTSVVAVPVTGGRS